MCCECLLWLWQGLCDGGVLRLTKCTQVTPDQYLNLSEFMDAIKETLEKKLADNQQLPKL